MGDEADRQIEEGMDDQQDAYTAMRGDPEHEAIGDAHDCGGHPEDSEREREEYIDARIDEWKAAHTKDPTGKRSVNRYWMLQGYDAALEWTQSWCAENYDIPTVAEYDKYCAGPCMARAGLDESPYRFVYLDGTNSGYKDAVDDFMADSAKMRGSE
jgi:hypothetical protein